SVPNSGSYWAHPHTGGLDADTGLYLPVIVDDPSEGNYDAEWIVVLDDWTDGIGKSPQQLYTELTSRNKPSTSTMPPTTTSPTSTTTTPRSTSTTPPSSTTTTTATSGMPGMSGNTSGRSDLLGGDAGDIDYPYYLINGRIPAAPTSFTARPGQRIRIRFINTG